MISKYRNTWKTLFKFFISELLQLFILRKPVNGLVFYSFTYRSSRRRYSVWKDVLKNFVKFTAKHLNQSLWQRRLWHLCFPVNIAKFLRTPFLQNKSGRLLLYVFLPWNNCTVFFYKNYVNRTYALLFLRILPKWPWNILNWFLIFPGETDLNSS